MDPVLWAGVLLARRAWRWPSLEVFVPSGGLLGFLAIAVDARRRVPGLSPRAVVGHWLSGAGRVRRAGTADSGVAVVAQDAHGSAHLLLDVPSGDDVLPDSDKRRKLKHWSGKIGKAKTLMLPSGAVDDRRPTVDALSEGMAIEAGQWVRVIEVRGTRVVVRPTDERPHAGERRRSRNRSNRSA